MKRKLVQQGTSTLMVSLPSKWCKEARLAKGAEISIQQVGPHLVLAADESAQAKELQLELSSLAESSIRTLITSAYRNGYDKVIVRFKTEQQFSILQHVVKTRLIGFDITEKKEGFCIVENITEPAKEQFDTIVRKVFQNIHVLFDLTKHRLRKQAYAEDYEEVEERIQKYDNFCRRATVKQGDAKTEFMLSFFTLIIHGQRELYHLNAAVKEASPAALKLLDACHELFRLLENAYVRKDHKLLAAIHDTEKELVYKQGYAALEHSQKKESIALYHIISAIRQFYQANSPLTTLISQ